MHKYIYITALYERIKSNCYFNLCTYSDYSFMYVCVRINLEFYMHTIWFHQYRELFIQIIKSSKKIGQNPFFYADPNVLKYDTKTKHTCMILSMDLRQLKDGLAA